jgi:hypothetical protein
MRNVLIEKIGTSTIVTTTNFVGDPNPRVFVYPSKHSIRKENESAFSVDFVISVEDLPRMIILFDELEDNLGTANIDEYIAEITSLGYFNSEFGNGGGGAVNYITITEDRALTAEDNGASLIIDGDITLTVPTGLPENFTVYTDVLETSTLTWNLDGGVSVTGNSGLFQDLNTQSMLYQLGETNAFRLIGELT